MVRRKWTRDSGDVTGRSDPMKPSWMSRQPDRLIRLAHQGIAKSCLNDSKLRVGELKGDAEMLVL